MTSPAGTSNGDSNGRVTLAVLAAKLDMLMDRFDEWDKTTRSDHDKVTVLCTKQERQDNWIKATIGGVVSAIIGAIWALIKS